jgi:serine/threonine-protein kinase
MDGLIGSYRLLGTIGEGGMGTVFVAEHVLLGRRAALKVLLPAYSANQEIVARFFNEARALTAINDPGIVQLFDFGYDDAGTAYIVMELLDGESLAQRLRRLGRLQPIDALRLVKQCTVTLGAAHAKGIIHRDLKPENLFVVGDPAVTGGERLKVLEFGVAKLAGHDPGHSKTRTGLVVGTPVFMSPEQCRGGEIDARSDIYALGCVLFTLLTGRPPFDHESSGELIAAHLREPAPALSSLLPDVSPVLDAIVASCLAKSPDARFGSMQSLGEAIDRASAALVATPHQAPTPPPFVPSPSGIDNATSPRRRVLIAAITAVACVAAGLIVLGMVAKDTSHPAAASASKAPDAPTAAKLPEPVVDAPAPEPRHADPPIAAVSPPPEAPAPPPEPTLKPVEPKRPARPPIHHAPPPPPPPSHDEPEITHAPPPPPGIDRND